MLREQKIQDEIQKEIKINQLKKNESEKNMAVGGKVQFSPQLKGSAIKKAYVNNQEGKKLSPQKSSPQKLNSQMG